jgi:hypothetical protein
MPITLDEFKRKAMEQGIPNYAIDQYIQKRQTGALQTQEDKVNLQIKQLQLQKAQQELTPESSPVGALSSGILKGILGIEQVPQDLRDEVTQQLIQEGYDPIAVEQEREGRKQKRKEDVESKKVGTMIQTMIGEFESVPKGQKGVGIGSFTKRLGFLFPEASEYEEARAGFAGALKSLVGESGRLTDKDIERIMKILPQVTDTPKQASIARDRIGKIMEEIYGKNVIGKQDKSSLEDLFSTFGGY